MMTTQNILTIPDKRFDPDLLLPAVDILKADGVIAYPTETVYGLGASMFSERAVERIFDIKCRQPSNPISVMVNSIQAALQLTHSVSTQAATLMKTYWPGPLTLVFKASAEVPPYLHGTNNKIGVRFPDHAISTALVTLLQGAITSTSANRTGLPAATSAADVATALANDVDLIIDAGTTSLQVPSTVIDVSGTEMRLLRAGAISSDDIKATLKGFTNEQ